MKNKKSALKGFAERIPVDGKPQMYEVKPPHTPTPWLIKGNRVTGGEYQTRGMDISLSGQPGKEHTVTAYALSFRTPKAEDAAFIVRAVNCHEELLEACEKVRDMVSAVCHCDPLTPGLTKAERMCDFCLAGNILKQAIAKAEGSL